MCWEQRERAVKALATISAKEVGFDDSFFGFICTLDEGDDWRSPEASRKANPNYGVSVKPDYLARQISKAERTPRVQNSVKRLHLNIWTAADCRWLDARAWAAGCDRPTPLAAWRMLLQGCSCTSGLDLSTKFDMTAAVHAFRTPGNMIRLLPRFWIPEETAAQARKG